MPINVGNWDAQVKLDERMAWLISGGRAPAEAMQDAGCQKYMQMLEIQNGK